MAIENEYKFTSVQKVDKPAVLKMIASLLEQNGLSFKTSERTHTDRYYDSPDMDITEQGCFLRLRNYGDGRMKLTIKRPACENKNLLSREEIEEFTDGSEKELMAFAGKYFPDVQVSTRPVLTIESERSSIKYKDDGKKKITVDQCTFVSGNRRKTFWELELESLDDVPKDGFDTIGLGEMLMSTSFVPVFNSKYERGLEWISKTL